MRSDQLRALARKFHQIGELIDGGNATRAKHLAALWSKRLDQLAADATKAELCESLDEEHRPVPYVPTGKVVDLEVEKARRM